MRQCPECGAYLDPCERCDCEKTKETAPGTTNTEGGMAAKETTKSQGDYITG